MKHGVCYIKGLHIACELKQQTKRRRNLKTILKCELDSTDPPMACLNMPKNDQHQPFYNTTISPRISFSNDFADPQQPIKLENSYREAPASSNFEFSVHNYTMISADELFFKGKMLPLRENCPKTTTLRDELLAGDGDYEDIVSSRIAKGTSRWKERLGLKRSHSIVPKKAEKNIDGALERIDEMTTSEMVYEDIKGESIGCILRKN